MLAPKVKEQAVDWVFQTGWLFVNRPGAVHPLTNTMIANLRSLVFPSYGRKNKPSRS